MLSDDILDFLENPDDFDEQQIQDLHRRISAIFSQPEQLTPILDMIISFYEHYSDLYDYSIWYLFKLHDIVPKIYKKRVAAAIVRNLDSENIDWIYSRLIV